MRRQCTIFVVEALLAAGAIILVGTAESVNGYKLELDASLESGMKHLTCESYCDHCECTGVFLERENKCVCSCPGDSADLDCIAEIQETKTLIGLDYTLEVRNYTTSQGGGQPGEQDEYTRIPRQVNGRRRGLGRGRSRPVVVAPYPGRNRPRQRVPVNRPARLNRRRPGRQQLTGARRRNMTTTSTPQPETTVAA